jgi:hypothetical protein
MRALIVAVVCLAAQRAALGEVPAAVGSIMRQYCVPCHNETHDLNLTTLPGETDRAHWSTILDKVETGKMPPPARQATAVQVPKLDAVVRAQLTSGIRSFFGEIAHVTAPRHLPEGAWLDLARTFAAPSVEAPKLERMLALRVSLGSERLTPLDVAVLGDAAVQVCSAVAEADQRLPPGKRRFFGGLGPRPSNADLRRAVTALWSSLYGEPPAQADLLRETAQLKRLGGVDGSWSAAWTDLCTLLLAGPKTLYGIYLSSAR